MNLYLCALSQCRFLYQIPIYTRYLDDAIRSRKSVRQFLDKPVALARVTDILSRANMAPSGTNVQPWHVHVVMGEKRAQGPGCDEFSRYRHVYAEHYADSNRRRSRNLQPGAWNQFHRVTRRILDVPDDRYIICGVSLGYEDTTAPVNTLVSEREPLHSFATFNI